MNSITHAGSTCISPAAHACPSRPFQRDTAILGSTQLQQCAAVPTSSPSLAAAASAAAGAPLAAAAACPRCRLPPSRNWHATRLHMPLGPCLPCTWRHLAVHLCSWLYWVCQAPCCLPLPLAAAAAPEVAELRTAEHTLDSLARPGVHMESTWAAQMLACAAPIAPYKLCREAVHTCLRPSSTNGAVLVQHVGQQAAGTHQKRASSGDRSRPLAAPLCRPSCCSAAA